MHGYVEELVYIYTKTIYIWITNSLCFVFYGGSPARQVNHKCIWWCAVTEKGTNLLKVDGSI